MEASQLVKRFGKEATKHTSVGGGAGFGGRRKLGIEGSKKGIWVANNNKIRDERKLKKAIPATWGGGKTEKPIMDDDGRSRGVNASERKYK